MNDPQSPLVERLAEIRRQELLEAFETRRQLAQARRNASETPGGHPVRPAASRADGSWPLLASLQGFLIRLRHAG